MRLAVTTSVDSQGCSPNGYARSNEEGGRKEEEEKEKEKEEKMMMMMRRRRKKKKRKKRRKKEEEEENYIPLPIHSLLTRAPTPTRRWSRRTARCGPRPPATTNEKAK